MTVARQFLRSRVGVAGAVILLFLIFVAVAAPVISPYNPLAQIGKPLQSPSWSHLFGTDEIGRDILSRVIYGTGDMLLVAFGAAALSVLVGVPVGVLAGYLGHWVDATTMRVVELILAIPGIVAALIAVSILGSGVPNLVLVLGLITAPGAVRLARASTLEIRDREFVLAERGMGAASGDIMLRTILPNILPPLIVHFVVTASVSIVASASLSFLGLGLPLPAPSWGAMLQNAQEFLSENPWYGVLPGIAIVLTVGAFDAIGYGLAQATSRRMPFQAARRGAE